MNKKVEVEKVNNRLSDVKNMNHQGLSIFPPEINLNEFYEKLQ